MNVEEMVSNVNAIVQPATNIDTLIKRWLNRGQKVFISTASGPGLHHEFSWMTLHDLTLTTTSGVHKYALSPLVKLSKTMTFRDTASDTFIDVIDRHEFQMRVPNPTSTGTPEVCFFVGYQPVLNQPSSASTLSLVSSSASDATVVVHIEGLDSSSVLVQEDITLTGTTPVASTKTYSRILARSTSAFMVGTLTITSNAGGVTNAVIPPRSRKGQYPVFAFYPIPSSALTITYDASMTLPEIVNNADTSFIPEEYHDAVEAYAIYCGAKHKKNDGLAAETLAYFNKRVSDAVQDDSGPDKLIIMQDYQRESYLGKGTLPGLYPRD